MSTAPMTDEEMQQFMKQIHVLEDEMKSSGAWIFGGALHGPDTATVVRVSEGDVLTTDGPLRGVEGIPRRLLPSGSRGSRRRSRLGVQGHCRNNAADRGPSVPGGVG